MVKPFIPREERKTVKRLTKGMKKLKLLYSKASESPSSKELDSFIQDEGYSTYFIY